MTAAVNTVQATQVVPVVGFVVKKFSALPGSPKDEEDDFKIDDDFKDLGFDDLDGGGGNFDEEDDY